MKKGTIFTQRFKHEGKTDKFVFNQMIGPFGHNVNVEYLNKFTAPAIIFNQLSTWPNANACCLICKVAAMYNGAFFCLLSHQFLYCLINFYLWFGYRDIAHTNGINSIE